VPTGWLPQRLTIPHAKHETETGALGAVGCACNTYGSVTVDRGPISCAGGLGNHVSTSRQISAALYRLLRSAATGSTSHRTSADVVLHPAATVGWCTHKRTPDETKRTVRTSFGQSKQLLRQLTGSCRDPM
jgi:hypothetical protein